MGARQLKVFCYERQSHDISTSRLSMTNAAEEILTQIIVWMRRCNGSRLLNIPEMHY